jgi:hypothetical protein
MPEKQRNKNNPLYTIHKTKKKINKTHYLKKTSTKQNKDMNLSLKSQG